MSRVSGNIMRRLQVAVLFALCATAAVAAAQDPASAPPADDTKREQMSKEVDEAVEAIRAYSVERRDEAVERAQRSMEDIDRRIGALQADMDRRWNRMSESARRQSQAAMADLRQRRRDLSEWSDGMRHSSGKAWGDVKAGFVNGYRELAEALRKARTEFEREAPPVEKDAGKGSGATSALHLRRISCLRLA